MPKKEEVLVPLVTAKGLKVHVKRRRGITSLTETLCGVYIDDMRDGYTEQVVDQVTLDSSNNVCKKCWVKPWDS